MILKKIGKNIYICQSCGYQSLKWLGKCPDCNEWDSLVERIQRDSSGNQNKSRSPSNMPVPIDSVEMDINNRMISKVQEFDRVLGGGLVSGSLVLIGGDPGIGKSTLMLQVLYGLATNKKKVLYVSGEE